MEKFIPKKKYYELIIRGDMNDADYLTTISRYDQKSFEKIRDEIDNILNNHIGRYKMREYKNVCNLNLPYDEEYGYCHTLDYLRLLMYDIDGYVYKVFYYGARRFEESFFKED